MYRWVWPAGDDAGVSLGDDDEMGMMQRMGWVVGVAAGCVLWATVSAGMCRAAQTEVQPVTKAQPGGAVETSVEQFLRRFERASEANDANGKAALYAEEVDRYFLRTHVTRDFVYRDVLQWLSGGRLITRFRLTVLSSEGGGDERTLLVRKEASWIAGQEKRTLSTRSQLILKRFGDGWKIVSERDYKPRG